MLEKTGRLSFSRRNGLLPRSLPTSQNFYGRGRGGAFYKKLYHSMWLFHPHSAVKIQPFYPVFPVAESTADVFCRLFLWSCKEKSINHFLWYSLPFPTGTDSRRTASPPVKIFAGGAGEDAFYKRLHHDIWLLHPHSTVKMQPFYPVFPLAESTANVFCRLFL